ncbi:hypothetical protein [Mesorhizobium sp. M0088]|uniref:hypothetical protein n=1 Tax=Mesorhizobium sp. M0088 TaxID=2956873 RepID=UPI00333A476F
MPLHHIPDDQRRAYCKAAIETLELWLRVVIDQELREPFGPDYLQAKRADGSYVINSRIRRGLTERSAAEPGRYSRLIDAAVLEDAIEIVCNPELFQAHFKRPLAQAFPNGREEARTFLNRLVTPRNKLSHANAISVREAEQVICYSRDAIESLKAFYTEKNMGKEFNTPTVVKLTDSFGRTTHAGEFRRNQTGSAVLPLSETALRPGDTLVLEVEVDSSFPPDSYDVQWVFPYQRIPPTGNRLVLKIENRHVNPCFVFFCLVTSKLDWHRLGEHDDSVAIQYKVLPPVG